MVSKYVFQGSSVADLGCGPGYFTIPMAELARPRGKVFAVDFDSKAVERVAKKAAVKGLDRIVEARIGSAAEVDFIPDHSVDFVFANGLLCCMKDHSGAVNEIRRILKDDGLAYLSVARFGSKRDPRAVTAVEWKSILEGFRVRKSGKGLLTRWALVSNEDGLHPGGMGGLSASAGPACCCA